MASRKTYFGIGLPKDLIDPGQGVPAARDPEDATPSDHSAPTVIDDEKVAEGLAQLRSWYQSDASEGARPAAASVPVQPQPVPPGQRPTAVGHASSDLPTAAPRSFAPDPMRATMFGHDVHRIDFDSLASAPDLPPAVYPSSPPGESRGARVGAPPPADPPPRQQAATPRPAASGATPQPDAFRFADYLLNQAAQPHAPGAWATADNTQVRARRRTPIIVLTIGIAALVVAVGLALQSKDRPNGAMAPAAPPSTGIEQLQAPQGVPERARAVAPVLPPGAADKASKPAARPADGDRPTVPPNTDRVVPSASTRPAKRHSTPVKAVAAARGEKESAAAPEAPPAAGAASESAPPAGATGSTTAAGASASAAPPTAGGGAPAAGDTERTTPARDTERTPPAPKVQSVRPAKATKAARDKAGAIIDADATLPPSMND